MIFNDLPNHSSLLKKSTIVLLKKYYRFIEKVLSFFIKASIKIKERYYFDKIKVVSFLVDVKYFRYLCSRQLGERVPRRVQKTPPLKSINNLNLLLL